jgi:hypothetical protein
MMIVAPGHRPTGGRWSTPRTVVKHLAILERRGWLRIERREGQPDLVEAMLPPGAIVSRVRVVDVD